MAIADCGEGVPCGIIPDWLLGQDSEALQGFIKLFDVFEHATVVDREFLDGFNDDLLFSLIRLLSLLADLQLGPCMQILSKVVEATLGQSILLASTCAVAACWLCCFNLALSFD